MLLLLPLLFLFSTVLAQQWSLSEDLELIQKVKLTPVEKAEHHPYAFKGEPISFKTANPLSVSYASLMFVYDNTLLPHFASTCLYHPDCSAYSKTSVVKYGILKGGLLSVDRLNRCNRIAGTDIRPSERDPLTHKCIEPVVTE